MKSYTVFAICLLFSVAFTAKKEDLVTEDLPGCGKFAFKTYSGYIPVDESNNFHYYFAESEKSPESDPLIIWFTGGPGCSSMESFFTEHGACVYDPVDNNDLPHLNEFSWNKNASVLYVESPAGVGFNTGYNGEPLNDEIAADQELAFVTNWFKDFPEYLSHDIYIVGESYGGIYVPYLAHRLHSNNLTTKTGGDINLVGIVIGNGATDWSVDGIPAYIELAWYHGLIPASLKAKVDKNQCKYSHVGQGKLSKACEEALDEFYEFTKGINRFDIYLSPSVGISSKPSVETFLRTVSKSSSEDFSKMFRDNTPLKGSATEYLNRPDVKSALHLNDYEGPYISCKNLDYEMLEKATLWIYPTLKEGGYRILHYSGDTDGAVPTIGTEKWIDSLNWKLKQPHRPFYIDDKVAGFLEKRDGLDFLVFHGAGHLVPFFMRKETQFSLYAWINDQEFPY